MRILTSIYFFIVILLAGCNQTSQESSSTIYVTIHPLRSIVESIVEDDLPIEVLLPSGAAAESYEPTPKQYIDVSRAQLVLSTGLLPFEESLLSRISDQKRVVNLSEGIDLIAGECSHGHTHSCSHHGVDPHIWTSPVELQIMARTCYNHIAAIYPDSTRYYQNYLALQSELEQLDVECRAKVLSSGVESFLIYHPALTYYARSYGIDQVAIEDDGKEPSAKSLAKIIERGRKEGINKILYQSQFPASSVEVIVKDLGAESVVFDPLAEDVIDNIKGLTEIIVSR